MEEKFILVSENGKDFYKDAEGNLILLDDFEYACGMMGMLEVDGFVCKIMYHHKEKN